MRLLKTGRIQVFGSYVGCEISHRANRSEWRISVLVFALVGLRLLSRHLLVVILDVTLRDSLLTRHFRSEFRLVVCAVVDFRYLRRHLLVVLIVALHDSPLAHRFRSDFLLLATVLSARSRRSRRVSNLWSRRLALGGASDRRRRRAASSLEGGGCQQTELLVVVLADGIVSDVAQRGSGYCSRDGAESPAVVEDGASSLELMLGWAVGCHHLDEGKQEGTVVVRGPLRCHVCCL
jgi:hypothetical protein